MGRLCDVAHAADVYPLHHSGIACFYQISFPQICAAAIIAISVAGQSRLGLSFTGFL